MKRKRMWLFVAIFIICHVITVRGEETENTTISLYEKWQESFIGELDFSEIQEMIDQELGKQKFSVKEMLKNIMKGEISFSKETVRELLYSLFFLRFDEEKEFILKIILLILFAAIFHVFTDVFDDGQMGNICFYMVYLLLFIFLANDFGEMSRELELKLQWVSSFMKGLTPAYYMTVAASTGVTTATVFYQGILILVMIIQMGLQCIVLPCVNLYILLMFVNHLSKEELVRKLAELLSMLIGWMLKTFMGIVVGMQVVQGLVAPVVDSLKRGVLGKTAGIIPGIGNAVNTATELLLTGAILIRNSFGVMVLLVFLAIGLEPMLHYIFMTFIYRVLAAIAEPISDKRMVSCLSTMGDGCMLLFRVFFHAEFLCVVTFLILTISFGGRV